MNRYPFTAAAAAAICLVLSACGGGGCDAGKPAGPPKAVAEWQAECGPFPPAPPASAPGG